MSGTINFNSDGLLVPRQDLGSVSPSSDDHGRLYNHDGSSVITLVDGSTSANKGLYMWDNAAGAWNPLKATMERAEELITNGNTAVARDTTNALDVARFLEGGKVEIPNGKLHLYGNRIKHVGDILHRDSSFPSGDDFRWAPDSTGTTDGDEVFDLYYYDSSAGTFTRNFRVHRGGNVEIPNGDLNLGTNQITNVNNIVGTGSNLLSLVTNGNNVVAYDNTNALTILEAKEGGNVEVPNGDLSVQNQRVQPGKAVPLSITHANWADGLADEEVHRIVLGSGESLEIHRLEMRMKGGGSSTSLDVDVYDATNATVLASTTAGSATTGSPVATSNSGVTILVRVSNSTGSAQKASIAASMYVV